MTIELGFDASKVKLKPNLQRISTVGAEPLEAFLSKQSGSAEKLIEEEEDSKSNKSNKSDQLSLAKISD